MRPKFSLFYLWMLIAGYIAVAVPVQPSYAAPQSGTLQVTIEPMEAVQAGANWKVGINPWKKSGESEQLAVGQHRVDFATPAGWILSTPGPMNVSVVAGKVTRATGTFRRQTGSLAVTVLPQGAVTAGAQWRVDGGAWKNSGSTQSDVASGHRNIEYKEVPGWIRPAGINVTIVSGQTQQVIGTYIPSTGSLRVTLQPDNIGGGQWRVDGGPWQQSRQLIDNIAVGAHQVEYGDLAGWVKPPTATVNITGGQSTQITGTYQPGTPERITVAGNVQAAKIIRRVSHLYPPMAREARIQGTVRFTAIIGVNGTVMQIQLISGHPLLVQAATDAVRQWTYSPTLVNGVPVEVVTQIDVNFTL